MYVDAGAPGQTISKYRHALNIKGPRTSPGAYVILLIPYCRVGVSSHGTQCTIRLREFTITDPHKSQQRTTRPGIVW